MVQIFCEGIRESLPAGGKRKGQMVREKQRKRGQKSLETG